MKFKLWIALAVVLTWCAAVGLIWIGRLTAPACPIGIYEDEREQL
jgi:hypothetical protein